MIQTRLPAAVAIAALIAISFDAAFAISGALSSSTPHVAFSLGTADRDITYCNSQTLDLYIPSNSVRRPLPLAVFVHGGGMTSGDKTNINPVLLNALASAGYAVAAINYRLAPISRFPAQIEDVKCAIRYLRDSAPGYGLDGSAIFAFGTSVGGQLVALAALTGPGSVFDVGPYMNQPSTVRAVVDMFGPANLSEDAGFSSSALFRVFGGDYSAGVLEQASPTHYVAANAPPIMLVQGVQDAKVHASQSFELYHELTVAGDQTQLVLVQNMGHMFMQVGPKPLDPSLENIGTEMVEFFNRYAGGD